MLGVIKGSIIIYINGCLHYIVFVSIYFDDVATKIHAASAAAAADDRATTTSLHALSEVEALDAGVVSAEAWNQEHFVALYTNYSKL